MSRAFALALALFLALPTYAPVLECLPALELARRHNLIFNSNEISFTMQDSSGANIHAVVGPDGIFRLAIQTRDDLGNHLADHMRAKALFKLAFDHVKENVKSIEGSWNRYFNGKPTSNLNTYIKYTSPPFNLSPSESAKKTFTGEQAVERGFTQVKVQEIRDRTGKLLRVVAHFYRPGE